MAASSFVTTDEFLELLHSTINLSELNREQLKYIRELQAQVRDLTLMVKSHEHAIERLRSEILNMRIDKL